jgi:hypothetical protein
LYTNLCKQVRLTVGFKSSKIRTTEIISLTAQGSPLKAAVRGPAGYVKSNQLIKLDASASIDPDDPDNNKPMIYTWECTREDFPAPCFQASDRGMQDGPRWVVNASLLTPDKEHTFTLNVSKGLRSTTAAPLVVIPRSAQIPTGQIVRLCGRGSQGDCPERHNTDAPLTLSIRLDATSAAASFSWFSEQVPGISTTGDTQLTIPPSALPTSGVLVVTAKLLLNEEQGLAALAVPLNDKPSCQAPGGIGCFQIQTINAEFPDAVFEARAVGFTDANVLR